MTIECGNIYSIGDRFLFQPLPAAAQSPKYFKVYVVLDKALVSPCQSFTPCVCLTSYEHRNGAISQLLYVFVSPFEKLRVLWIL